MMWWYQSTEAGRKQVLGKHDEAVARQVPV